MKKMSNFAKIAIVAAIGFSALGVLNLPMPGLMAVKIVHMFRTDFRTER